MPLDGPVVRGGRPGARAPTGGGQLGATSRTLLTELPATFAMERGTERGSLLRWNRPRCPLHTGRQQDGMRRHPSAARPPTRVAKPSTHAALIALKNGPF